ncbi:MAG: D-2-hydroxyacid dehydrogenase [Chloroflexi bacterium]|nr:MAG: D-2-hydroxyacid dehydrogenase [Chloroflexota bacterium]
MTNIVVWSAFRNTPETVAARFPDDRIIRIADEAHLGDAQDAEVAFSGNNPQRVRQLLDATLHRYRDNQSRHEWRSHPQQELRDATVVVYGMGSIGGEVARLASGVGMRVVGLRRSAGPTLAEAVGEADFLAITAPLTPATRGAVSRDIIGRMKPTAWIVNIARGAIVDEAAMIDALREKRLGGAALDVFAKEPLPAESPLWSFDNVILTPHTSGDSPRVAERTLTLFAENLRRYKAGEPLLNRVDFAAGY